MNPPAFQYYVSANQSPAELTIKVSVASKPARRSCVDGRGQRSHRRGTVAQARQLLRASPSPILLMPYVDRGHRAIRFEGWLGLTAMFGSEVVTELASPAEIERLRTDVEVLRTLRSRAA
jgi:hypothetical protein